MTKTNLPKFNTGSALIVALLITAIVAALATAIVLRQRVIIRETQLVMNADTAYLDMQSVQDWAINTLTADLSTNAVEIFPKTMAVINFNNAQITGTIADQLGLFNINSLVNASNQTQFIRLLQAVDPNITINVGSDIAKAVTDWLTVSNADEIYMRQDPPYRAGHQLMVHPSELRLVNGITDKIYQELAPYIATLPNTDDKININSAPAPVMMSLADKMTLAQAQTLIACREENKGFLNPDDFAVKCFQNLKLQLDPSISLLTSSNSFLVNGTVIMDQQILRMSSLLQRNITSSGDNNNTNKITIKVLWQSWDGF